MRAQPFHLGHQHLVEHVMDDGKVPTIILGSAQESDTLKNPYTVNERAAMIRLVYPWIQIFSIEDKESEEKWISAVTELIDHSPADPATIYIHEKDEDRYSFVYYGIQYSNEHYSKMYEVEGIEVEVLPTAEHDIRAQMIREDLKSHKDFLDPKVYQYIKELNVKKSKNTGYGI